MYSEKQLEHLMAVVDSIYLGYNTACADEAHHFYDGGVYSNTNYYLRKEKDGTYSITKFHFSDDGADEEGDTESFKSSYSVLRWIRSNDLEDSILHRDLELFSPSELKEVSSAFGEVFAESIKKINSRSPDFFWSFSVFNNCKDTILRWKKKADDIFYSNKDVQRLVGLGFIKEKSYLHPNSICCYGPKVCISYDYKYFGGDTVFSFNLTQDLFVDGSINPKFIFGWTGSEDEAINAAVNHILKQIIYQADPANKEESHRRFVDAMCRHYTEGHYEGD